ncbi:MAG TPA: amidohydrolase family protein, partial [Desulfurivibrionaceae bacterium]|nr:amidohydrolase family protein [Desulfurivibrionaceae bacterium]
QEPDRYIYRAPFVLPVCAPVIVDGAVITEQGRVVAVGRYGDLKETDAELVDYEGHVITPALVNGHVHLELSHLAALGQEPQGAQGDMPSWIAALLEQRAAAIHLEEAAADARYALARLYAGGCAAVIDIGNLPESRTLGEGFKTAISFHQEFLGLAAASQQQAMERLQAAPPDLCCTAHAPYSTGATLLRALKERTRQNKCLFPIHVAESADEIELLRNGTGRFRVFLEERGAWDGSFTPPGVGAVAYLDRLGVLDAQTLCVHGVHVTAEEIRLLAERGARVCLCPGSNRYMGVGRAPLAAMLAQGILPALGTDSLASNSHLSLWQEMAILREEHPEVPPGEVLAMASRNGARILGIERELGVIAPGVSSSLVAVECAAKTGDEALEYLTTAGPVIRLEWIE